MNDAVGISRSGGNEDVEKPLVDRQIHSLGGDVGGGSVHRDRAALLDAGRRHGDIAAFVQSIDLGPGKDRDRGTWSDRLGQPVGVVGEELAGLRVESRVRSEEHTSELQSLMRISYA